VSTHAAPSNASKLSLDVAAVGNAIVDVLSQAEDAFLAEIGLAKGAMTLVGAAEAEALYGKIGAATECSGGSAANTVVGVALLGGRAGFIGKVRDDQLGRIFRHDIHAVGVEFDTPAAASGPSTARCLVMVTPDAQRTMQTFLGIAAELGPDDVDAEMIRRAGVTYLEGYLFDPPPAKKAFERAAALAHGAGKRVALTLSDPFCVDRHRDDFQRLIADHVDILFANEAEITSLYKASDFDSALQIVRGHCEVAVLTRSEKGAVVVSGGEMHVIDAEPVARVVDTTGAGDLFAAGFLFGYTHGLGLATAGRIGAICAAEVISHFGARPATSLADLVEKKIGIKVC
jgi:sugar/nucleoside kinase (ribokinase family)